MVHTHFFHVTGMNEIISYLLYLLFSQVDPALSFPLTIAKIKVKFEY